MKHLPLAALLLLLVACTEASPARHTFQLVVEEGVPTAISSGTPKYDQPLFTYEEILELKQDPENEDSLLYRPRSFIQDEHGSFYVIDSGNGRIAAFDAEGNFVWGIGRSGEGPGEFQNLTSLHVRGGILQVFDSRSLRVTRFSTDGTLLDVHTFARTVSDRQLGFLSSAQVIPDGRAVLTGQIDRRDDEFSVYAIRVSVLGPNEEVEWEAVTPFHKTLSWVPVGGVLGYTTRIPFASRASVSFEPSHGVLISPGDEPVLLLHDMDGTLRRRIRIKLDARPVSAEEKAEVLDAFDRDIAAASGSSAERLRAMKESTAFPEHHPYWSGAGLDEYGFIWIGKEESGADREAAGGGFLYMVLSPEGEYLGDTRRPVSGMITHGRLLARLTDEETGEERLVVYEMRPAVEGFAYPREE